jgi:hypothetical protein
MKYEGNRHELRGLLTQVYGENGKMYAREACSCGGCFDRTFEIHDGDTVVAFRRLWIGGHLRKLKLVAMEFKSSKESILEDVELAAHESATKYYCGGQLYDNYGVDGSKSFAAGLIKSLSADVETIDLPAAAKGETKI